MTLVVGYDRHPASHAALLFAQDLAEALNVHLHVVHVVDLADSAIAADSPSAGTKTEQRLEAEHQHVRAVLEATAVRWTYHTMSGDPVAALMSAASEQEAAMIIVGRPEQGIGAALGHMMSGAVARNLIRRCRSPVVVVPESGDGHR